MLKGQNGVGGLAVAFSDNGLASGVGSRSVGVGQHGAECLCQGSRGSICQAGACWAWVPPAWSLRAGQCADGEHWEEESLELHIEDWGFLFG